MNSRIGAHGVTCAAFLQESDYEHEEEREALPRMRKTQLTQLA